MNLEELKEGICQSIKRINYLTEKVNDAEKTVREGRIAWDSFLSNSYDREDLYYAEIMLSEAMNELREAEIAHNELLELHKKLTGYDWYSPE